MQCALCTETKLVMTSRQDIEIDDCPKRRGVWLDRGELDKIIERSQQELPVAPLQPLTSVMPTSLEGYRDDSVHGESRHGSGHGGGRHESFLKQLRDWRARIEVRIEHEHLPHFSTITAR